MTTSHQLTRTGSKQHGLDPGAKSSCVRTAPQGSGGLPHSFQWTQVLLVVGSSSLLSCHRSSGPAVWALQPQSPPSRLLGTGFSLPQAPQAQVSVRTRGHPGLQDSRRVVPEAAAAGERLHHLPGPAQGGRDDPGFPGTKSLTPTAAPVPDSAGCRSHVGMCVCVSPLTRPEPACGGPAWLPMSCWALALAHTASHSHHHTPSHSQHHTHAITLTHHTHTITHYHTHTTHTITHTPSHTQYHSHHHTH